MSCIAGCHVGALYVHELESEHVLSQRGIILASSNVGVLRRKVHFCLCGGKNSLHLEQLNELDDQDGSKGGDDEQRDKSSAFGADFLLVSDPEEPGL